MNSIAKIFNSLEGNWRFHRTISDFGTIKGNAIFKRSEAENNLLHYREDGQLTTKDGSNPVYREYLYRYENEKISAYFAEKKDSLFHTLTFPEASTPTIATATHLCVCDLYEATYQFFSEDVFELTYVVVGPKKNYTMKTRFQRLQNLA